MDKLGPLENTSVSEDPILNYYKKTPIIGVIVIVVMLII
jgi:hypothetical protein